MYKRILTTLIAVLVASLVLVGGAFAMVVAADGGNPAVVQSSQPLISEKVAGLNLTSQVSQVTRPLVSEKLAGLRLSQPTTVSVSTGSSFDWSDAGIGAGVMFASLLALSAGAITVRRHHRPLAH